MKLKKLKEIDILHTIVDIKWDKKSYGASFDIDNKIMVIGIKDADIGEIFMLLQHEIMEMLMVLMGYRYTDYANGGSYRFFLDHKEFEGLIQIYTVIIQKFIK